MELVTRWEEISCFKCNGLFAVPESVRNRLVETHNNFYCPFCGQIQHFVKETKSEKFSKEIKRLKESQAWCNMTIEEKNHKIETLKRSRASIKGVVTKMKKASDGGKGE